MGAAVNFEKVILLTLAPCDTEICRVKFGQGLSIPEKEKGKQPAVRTIILPIKNNPELSRLIGEGASQQRLAYNMGVDWLNREPNLPLPVSQKRGTIANRSLCGRLSALRKQPKAEGGGWLVEKKKGKKPGRILEGHRHIQDTGLKLAHLANQRFRDDRDKRLARIDAAEDAFADAAVNPPRTKREWRELERLERRYARDQRNKRRTLAHRTRKDGTHTLEIAHNTDFQVLDRRRIKWGKVIVELFRSLPKGCELDKDKPAKERIVRSFRFVEVRGRQVSARTPLSERRYEIHIAIEEPSAPKLDVSLIEKPDEILGVDVGVKRNWAFSSDAAPKHYDGQYSRKRTRPRKMQQRARRKPAGSKRRQQLERERRQLLRRRAEDMKRLWNMHAIDVLEQERPRAVAVESLDFKAMTSSAKGSTEHPGKSVAAKRGLNRAMSAAALSGTLKILGQQAVKRGIPVLPIYAPGTSLTCHRCGNWQKGNRESQAAFQCRKCGLSCNADNNGAKIIRNRAFYRVRQSCHGELVYLEDAPTGWEVQPSREVAQPMLFSLANNNRAQAGAESTSKPKRNVASRKAGSAAQGRESVSKAESQVQNRMLC